MFVKTIQIKETYTRTSKLNQTHSYTRTKTLALFECDDCGANFQRPLGQMDYRRLSNEYGHVCPNCNPKRFAQKRGAERRKIWNLPADSDLKITEI